MNIFLRPQFLTMYLNEPDHAGHEAGPDSVQVSSCISRTYTGHLTLTLPHYAHVCCQDNLRIYVSTTKRRAALSWIRTHSVGKCSTN